MQGLASDDIAQLSLNRGRYKRTSDLAMLVVAHLTLLPVFLLLWSVIPLAIWLQDRGSIFYVQERVGKGGRVFKVLKFRTMIPGADQLGPAWTVENDPRITSLGRSLRRSGLDELPQLICVWRGEMSLVGPRPLCVNEHKLLVEQIGGFDQRSQILPGVTGLAQILDRTDNADDKFRYDMLYLRNMCLRLDLKLLLISALWIFTGRGDKRSGKANIELGESNS